MHFKFHAELFVLLLLLFWERERSGTRLYGRLITARDGKQKLFDKFSLALGSLFLSSPIHIHSSSFHRVGETARTTYIFLTGDELFREHTHHHQQQHGGILHFVAEWKVAVVWRRLFKCFIDRISTLFASFLLLFFLVCVCVLSLKNCWKLLLVTYLFYEPLNIAHSAVHYSRRAS